jgi:hypothetical protein
MLSGLLPQVSRQLVLLKPAFTLPSHATINTWIQRQSTPFHTSETLKSVETLIVTTKSTSLPLLQLLQPLTTPPCLIGAAVSTKPSRSTLLLAPTDFRLWLSLKISSGLDHRPLVMEPWACHTSLVAVLLQLDAETVSGSLPSERNVMMEA